MAEDSPPKTNIKMMPVRNTSPHGVVQHLNEIVADLSEIYVVVKTKDGWIYECLSGDLSGLTTAILVLQNHALNVLNT